MKRAFHRLSRKYHPDKNVGKDSLPSAEALFLRVREAYTTLSNADARRAYDFEIGGVF